jgi:hypothetical protein
LGDKNKAEIAEEAEKWTGIGGVPFFVGSKPGSKKKYVETDLTTCIPRAYDVINTNDILV